MLKRCEFFVGERLWLESAAGCGNDRADSAATDELASATPDEPTIDEPNATVSINRKESTSEALWLSYSGESGLRGPGQRPAQLEAWVCRYAVIQAGGFGFFGA